MEPLPAATAAPIRRVAERDQRPALARLALGGATPGHADEVLAFAKRMGIDLSLMWAAHRGDGRIGAVALIVPQTGRTGMFFTSPATTPPTIAELAQVIDTACREAPLEKVKLAQALVSPEETHLRAAFEAGGFWELAVLSYMQARVPRRAEAPALPPRVTFETYDAAHRDDYLLVLEESYRNTMDCPGLRGLRDTGDVLDGHMSAGEFDASLWTLVRIDGRPAGVLLLNRVPQADCVELVYLGLAPDFRGRGLGTLLMQRAMHLCAQRNERTLTLAVDEHNAPALSLYRAAGFRRTMKRVALIRDCATRK